MPRNKVNARSVALELLAWVLQRGRPFDEALSRNRNWHSLADRDRAFARLIAATVIRRMGQLDAVIDAFLDKPLKARNPNLRNILRLGAAQLLFLETPAHAAVSTSLDLAGQEAGLAGFKGLMNAILRRIDREGKSLLEGLDAGRLTLPGWLWESWSKAYGEEETRAVAEALLQEPDLDITVKEKAETWARRLGGTALPWGAVRCHDQRGEVSRMAGFDEGAWWVQDLAASLTIRALGSLEGVEALDLCAAPGGKTAALAAAGARVTALERAAGRVKRLQENLSRLKLPVTVEAGDVLHWRPAKAAELVVLDAPCSATGILRRHPDIKLLRKPEELDSLRRLQGRLLSAAAEMTAAGGTLLYIVCSLQPEEGPDQISAFLSSELGATFERKPFSREDLFGHEELLNAEGDFRSLPSHLKELGGIDGFYACRLTRKAL